MRKSDMLAWICNECQYKGNKVVIFMPENVYAENKEKGLTPKYCPYCGVGND